MRPNENRRMVAQQKDTTDNSRSTSIELRQYSAPLPPPEMMAEYEKIAPGSAERLIRRFEIQGDHRQSCERTLVRTLSVKSIGGLICGFIIAMTAIIGGIYTALQGKPWLGGSLSFTGLGILIGSFLADRFLPSSKAEDKQE